MLRFYFRENEELDLGLTQLCGHNDGKGKILFSTYWERILGVSFQVSFFNVNFKVIKFEKIYLE